MRFVKADGVWSCENIVNIAYLPRTVWSSWSGARLDIDTSSSCPWGVDTFINRNFSNPRCLKPTVKVLVRPKYWLSARIDWLEKSCSSDPPSSLNFIINLPTSFPITRGTFWYQTLHLTAKEMVENQEERDGNEAKLIDPVLLCISQLTEQLFSCFQSLKWFSWSTEA